MVLSAGSQKMQVTSNISLGALTHSVEQNSKLMKEQMSYLKTFVLEEYSKGNYVVVGADWNMCPPNFDCQDYEADESIPVMQMNIDENIFPKDWQWVFDETHSTNRKMAAPYKKGETFTTLIDFYLVSPNISVLNVETINQDFKYSDHHPVKLKIQLK